VRVLVAGAGISGCAAALAASEAGHEVTLLEVGRTAGGVLRDEEINTGSWYRNCQYFNVGTEWFDLFLRCSGARFTMFPHRYGSWNDLFMTRVAQQDFAQVVVPGAEARPITDETALSSVADRLSRYPHSVSKEVRRWADSWGDLETLHHENSDLMQVGRVFHCDDVDGTISCKRLSEIGELLYGVPRDIHRPALPVREAALPIDGWNRAFEAVTRALVARRVRVEFGARASVRLERCRVQVDFLQETCSPDLVVWCANPHPLMTALGLGRLDSPVTKMSSLLCEVDGSLPPQPMYWQVFSRSMPIVRLFFHEHRQVPRLTVEAFDSRLEMPEVAKLASEVLKDFGFDMRLKPVAVVPDRRYVLTTIRDRDLLSSMDDLATRVPVVTGGWSFFGRDQRIGHIFRAMRDWNAL